MKIAIPVDRNDDDANVFEHFGRAPYYCIVTIGNNNEIESIEFYQNPAVDEHEPGDLPSFLASKKVNVLIAMGIGRRAMYYFDQLGIRVITGAGGRVTDVVKKFLEGKLESTPYEPEHKWHDHY